MIALDFNNVSEVLSEYKGRMAKLKPEPVFFFPYLQRVLREDMEKRPQTYPMDVKLPKANKYLLKGDYEPERVIHLEKPYTLDDGETPIWIGNSTKQAFLRFGYKNLDARFISDAKLDMECIHMFLGGSSGQGKSVTLNAMLGALCYEYAPWELELHMSDAKIIEFKKYGIGHIIPHIATIAATEDADFVISVLERAAREMNERAKIFGNLQVSNLKGFREKTGLVLPRVIIVMDEVESTFKMAGKQASKIANLIDTFTRLGRAAGYHLIMATQNLSSEIPSSAMGQVRLRACLGANEKTSDAVLGNNGAQANFGRIGRLITNTEVMTGGDTFQYNVKYQTPFLTDDNFEEEMEFLERKGKESGFARNLSFYDENDVKTMAQFDPIIDQVQARLTTDKGRKKSQQEVCLGFPAFVTDDVDKLLKIKLDLKDVENILICSTLTENTFMQLHNLSRSISTSYAQVHWSSDTDLLGAVEKALLKGEVREAATPPLSNMMDDLVRKRTFLLYLDSLLGGVSYDQKEIETRLAQDKIPKEQWGNSLLCARATAYYACAKSAEHRAIWETVSGRYPTFLQVYKDYEKYNALIDPITKDNFSKTCYYLGDLSKIIGYGRDSKSKMIDVLKKTLQDASRVGVMFVLYTRSMEGLTDLVSGIRYVIFDNPDGRDWTRMRTEAPAAVNKVLAVLYDSLDTENPQHKFKKTLLKEEF